VQAAQVPDRRLLNKAQEIFRSCAPSVRLIGASLSWDELVDDLAEYNDVNAMSHLTVLKKNSRTGKQCVTRLLNQ
jgi:hypothetical protein